MKLNEGFALVATAPDGIARLRELILSLAVQGKLVPQDPRDESADALLKEICTEKDRLIGEGKIRRNKPLSQISHEEKPSDLPEKWRWIRLGIAIELISGQHLGPSEYVDGLGSEIPYLTGPAEFGACSPEPTRSTVVRRAVAVRGDILITVKGSGVGKLNAVSQAEIAISRQLMAIRPIKLNAHFVQLVLRAMGAVFQQKAVGIAIPGISREDVTEAVIGLPPLAEQARIVAKVDELMHVCDELGVRGRLEAEQHARLTATLFDALTASDSPHALAENWVRVAAHFDLLLDRPEAVDALEQTVVQLAVRGLLMPQKPSDEPVDELLQKIKEEKNKLIAKGTIRRDRPVPAITEGDKPFELPEQWKWVRTQDICAVITDGDHQAPPKAQEGVPFLVIGDVRWGNLDVATASRFVPDAYFDRLDWSKKPIAGDILYTTVGSFGIPVPVTEDVRFCFQRHIGLFRPAHVTLQPFLNLVLRSALVLQQASARATGIAQKTVPLSALRDFKVPLPPLAEQHRIVARVEDLGRLCANLREHLAARQTCQARFAAALVEQTTSTPPTVENADDLAAAA